MTARTVLVTGATGLQGGATARRLQEEGYQVRALARSLDSQPAKDLVAGGISVVKADFDHPDSVRRAAAGADAAFVIGTPTEVGPDGERQQAGAVLDAVVAAGVQQVVYSSAAAADRDTGIPWFESKKAIEAHVRTLPVTWTIVAPAVFMDVVVAPHVVRSLRGGTLEMALPPNTPLQYCDVADIGGFTALVLSRPDEFAGRRIDIASDERNGRELAAVLAAASGHAITYAESSLEALADWDPQLGRMFRWFNDVGFGIDLATLHGDHPEVRWHSFDDWAASRSWNILDQAPAETAW